MAERDEAPEPEADRAAGAPGGLLPLVCGLLCLEAALFVAFSANHLDMPAVLGIHLGLCAVTATIGRWWVRARSTVAHAGDNAATVLHLAAWTVLGGPFGTVIAAMLLVPRRDGMADGAGSGSLATPYEPKPPGADGQNKMTRLELLHSALLDRRLRIGGAHPVRPLLDVMIEGTQTEKLDALSLVSKRFAPALVPALKRALEDGDSSVRVLAATVMAQQHNAHTKRIGVLQTAARAAPERSDGWSELGQACLDYAESGLLEASRAATEANQGRAHLARSHVASSHMVRAKSLDPVIV
jgi:hypothetical protein